MTPYWRFAHRLALALGHANPGHLMATMPGRVLDGWRAFDAVEPIGEPHGDYRAAMLAMLMANAWLRDKGRRRYTMDDFMLRFGERRRRTPADLAQQVIAMNALMGGTFIDKRKQGA